MSRYFYARLPYKRLQIVTGAIIMHVNILGTTAEIDETAIAEPSAAIRAQVQEYERGDRRVFDLTVTYPNGLTGEVLNVLTDIPYGETYTYGEIAARLDTAAVAVGQACGRNPVPLVVPCHRIVGKNSRGGFSAGSPDNHTLKRRLLDLERQQRTTTETEQTQLPTDSEESSTPMRS